MGPALASPSTLNTPLHTLNCTAFAFASAADKSCPKVLVRAPSDQSQVYERCDGSKTGKVNLCAAAAPTITGTSACFALSEHSIPAAPALRMSACGAMVGGQFS